MLMLLSILFWGAPPSLGISALGLSAWRYGLLCRGLPGFRGLYGFRGVWDG